MNANLRLSIGDVKPPVHIMDNSNTVQQQCRVLKSTVIGFVVICLRYTIQLMSSVVHTTGRAETAKWNAAEEDALLDYLIEHKAGAGDGGVPKEATFNGAAAAIAHLRTSGAAKTGKICRSNFNGVS